MEEINFHLKRQGTPSTSLSFRSFVINCFHLETFIITLIIIIMASSILFSLHSQKKHLYGVRYNTAKNSNKEDLNKLAPLLHLSRD